MYGVYGVYGVQGQSKPVATSAVRLLACIAPALVSCSSQHKQLVTQPLATLCISGNREQAKHAVRSRRFCMSNGRECRSLNLGPIPSMEKSRIGL